MREAGWICAAFAFRAQRLDFAITGAPSGGAKDFLQILGFQTSLMAFRLRGALAWKKLKCAAQREPESCSRGRYDIFGGLLLRLVNVAGHRSCWTDVRSKVRL